MAGGNPILRPDIPDAARGIVSEIRKLGPSRAVRSGRGSVSGSYPSRKMGVTIQFESHRNELAFILELEHDPEVLEYYDQPPPIALEYRSKTDRLVRVTHTPDFFVIRTDGAFWVECKPEKKLRETEKVQPNRFCRGEEGWRCPPGEAYAGQFGLGYRVRSSDDIDWIFLENVDFLEDYLRAETIEVEEWAANFLQSLLRTGVAHTLEELLTHAAAARIPADTVYLLLLADRLYVDLTAARLTKPGRVRVFQNREEAIAFSGNQLGLEPSVALPETPQFEKIRERTVRASPMALAKAAGMKDALVAGNPEIPARTLRRWKAAYQQAEMEVGDGYIGLLPRTGERGNRTRRLPPETLALTDQFILDKYENARRPNLYSVWAQLIAECRTQNLPEPSYPTFRTIALNRPVLEKELARSGKRAAYSLEPFHYELSPTTPRHGVRPFHIGHLDHTELDIQLVCSVTGQNLGRPWLSLLTDAFSRRTLAFVLSFEPPSYRSCMKLFRECVRRHHRLPAVLVTDGGREFLGRYFQTLLARYEITRKVRPPAESRFGSVCERLFGTTNSRFVHNLLGNTRLYAENPRFAVGGRNPKRQAVWTLEALHRFTADFLYEVHDGLEHPALGQSPKEAFLAGLNATGNRAHKVIHNDFLFYLATLPTTAKGKGTVIPSRGVKINRIYYWHQHFRRLPKGGVEVPVKYDPENMGVGWVFFNHRWIECHSEYYTTFMGRTESEISAASTEIRRRLARHEGTAKLTAYRLAEFLKEADREENGLIRTQRQRVAAERAIAVSPKPQPSNPSEGVSSEKISKAEIAKPRFTFTEDELDMLEELK
jgi:putative transposase